MQRLFGMFKDSSSNDEGSVLRMEGHQVMDKIAAFKFRAGFKVEESGSGLRAFRADVRFTSSKRSCF